MSNIRICVEDDIFVSSSTNQVDTILYFESNGRCFPSSSWTDFPNFILGTWSYSVIANRYSENTTFKLYFEDGPYRLDVFKDPNMNLKISCINFRYRELCEFIAECSYNEFVIELYRAAKSFNYILYKNGLSKGEFESDYNQTICIMRDLKKIIKN
jgi:hypothetical protein